MAEDRDDAAGILPPDRRSAAAPWSLGAFTGTSYDKGRPVLVQALWFAVMNLVFVKWWLPPSLRPMILRMFGSAVDDGVFIRHHVRILWPWKLTIGADSWIGEGAWILNLEPVRIGRDVCISQEVRLITGSHDARSPSFEYDNGPITIGDGTWMAFGAVALRGVTIGSGTVVGARAIVRRDVPTGGFVAR